jgi:sugar lactone lactonase YvrE
MAVHRIASAFALHLARPLAGLLLALAIGAPAHAVTYVSVDDHPSPVTLTVGETVTVRFDVAKAGGAVDCTLVRDPARAGKFDPTFPFAFAQNATDGGSGDLDPAPAKIALPISLLPQMPAGAYLFRLQDRSDASTLDAPFWSIVPRPEPQAISGRVLVISSAQPGGRGESLVASAAIRPDGSYTLPVAPGTYILFAEWLGGLRSQRQVVNIVAGQHVGPVDLSLLQGQEVSGVVREAGQPAVDALVQAVAADGRLFATKTFRDGAYTLVLPAGDYRFNTPGGVERVIVTDQPLDGVDFPAPTPGPAPAPGTIVTVAGNGLPGPGGEGRRATSARLLNPQDVAVDAAGNLYIVSNATNRVHRVDATTGVLTTVAGSGATEALRGLTPIQGSTGGFSGDGGKAVAALLSSPQHIALDAAGNLYISDLNNRRVRKVDAQTGIITTVAGSGPVVGEGAASFTGDGGPAVAATLNGPQAIAFDGAGNLYIADNLNGRVRRVSPAGIISTVAGGGTAPVKDGAQATAIALNRPRNLAVDGTGNLFIWDGSLNRVLKVSPAGIVSLYAGNGTVGFSGDGGPATEAQLNAAFLRMTVDRAGNLYLGDAENRRVRKVSPEGIITTVAGSGPVGPGTAGEFAGDGGPATEARLRRPNGVAIDPAGNLLIADGPDRRIRKVIGVAAPGLVGGR